MSTLHRFFVDAGTIEDDRATLAGDQARQIATVLRLSTGDRVVLVRDGEETLVELGSVTPSRVAGLVVARGPSAAEPRLRLTLALPLLRGDRGEEVVEAVTQLGVARIVPFTSERSVARDLSDAKRSRWERIGREAAETARRGRVPEIAVRVTWADLLMTIDPPIVVAWEGERATRLRDAVSAGMTALSLVIGPEGGLTEDEVALARSSGASTVSLGPRNLRSETAAIAAVAEVFAIVEM